MFDVLSMANQQENMGHYVARMEIGDTPGFRNDAIHNLVKKHSMDDFRYSPSRGEPTLTEKVIATQWPNEKVDDVVIGPANFLITAALAAVSSPGDFILLPDPGFPTYKLATDFLGLKIIYYPTYRDGRPSFPDIEKFLEQLTVKPCAIIINNPSNPMGIAFSGSLIASAVRNLSNKGISIIIDETYVNLVYESIEPIIEGLEAIRIRSFSKEHCAPGLRVGYAIGNSHTARVMSDFISFSISCSPRFIQLAVAEYLGTEEAAQFTSELKTKMAKRIAFISSSIPRRNLKAVPNSAFYVMLDTGDISGEEAFRSMLKNNVATCPGSRFGESTEYSVRVSLAGSESNFERDVEMLKNALEKLGS
jgi:aspartate aminotransferase